MTTTRRVVPLRYRLAVVSRVIAATAGSYGVCVLLAIAGAWALPLSREEAGTAATLAALLAMPVAAMGCFWARSAARAWIGLAAFAALFASIALAAGWRP